MPAHLWNELGIDDPEHYNLVLCCFYLGKGLLETRDLLARGQDDPEVSFVLETAVFSGLDLTRDSITKTS